MRVLLLGVVFLCSGRVRAEEPAKKPLDVRLLNLDDEGYNDALAEMRALDAGGKKKLSAALAKHARTSTSAEERSNAVAALGDLAAEVPANVAALTAALKDKSPTVRQAAISGLQRAGKPTSQTIAALTRMLSDKERGVIAKALDALGTFGPAARSAAPGVRKLLKHENESIRSLAASALEAIEEKPQTAEGGPPK